MNPNRAFDFRMRLGGGREGWTERARGVCLWMLICGTPLVVFLPATEQFVQPKYEWIALWTAALLALTAVRAARGTAVWLPVNPASAALAAWVVWRTASIAWAASPSLAWDDARRWLILALAVALCLDVIGDSRRRLVRLGWGLCAAAAVTAAWTLWEDFAGAFAPQWSHVVARLPDWRGRLSAGLGNTGHIADFLALAFVMNLMLCLYARRRYAWVAGAALTLSAAAMMVCWSAHSNAGLIVAALAAAVAFSRRYGLRGWRRRWRRLAALGALFVSVVVFYLTDHPLNPHRPSLLTEAFSSGRWLEGGSTRLAIWRPGLHMAMEHRWLGVGAGNFPYVFPSTVVESVQRDYPLYAGLYTNAAHNELLQSWCELGVVGVMLAILLIAVPLWMLAARRYEGGPVTFAIRLAMLGFLAAFAVHAQMNFNLQLPATSLWLVFVAALAGWMRDRGERVRDAPLGLEMDAGPFAIEAVALRMQKIRAVGLKANGATGAAILLALALAVGAAMIGGAGRRTLSDYHYWRARNAIQTLQSQGAAAPDAMSGARATALRDEVWRQFGLALAINPRHHDCRSAYVTFLMEQGRHAEALRQLDLVMRRLDSPELYDRRAFCRQKSGDAQGALEDWVTFYSRQPSARMARPEHFRAVMNAAMRPDRIDNNAPGAQPEHARPEKPS